jgi:hypothetical protein
LLTHADFRTSRRVRLLFDHLAQALRTHAAEGLRGEPFGGGQRGGDVLYPPTLRRRKSKRTRR